MAADADDELRRTTDVPPDTRSLALMQHTYRHILWGEVYHSTAMAQDSFIVHCSDTPLTVDSLVSRFEMFEFSCVRSSVKIILFLL